MFSMLLRLTTKYNPSGAGSLVSEKSEYGSNTWKPMSQARRTKKELFEVSALFAATDSRERQTPSLKGPTAYLVYNSLSANCLINCLLWVYSMLKITRDANIFVQFCQSVRL